MEEQFLGVQPIIDREGVERHMRVWSGDGETGHLFITGISVEKVEDGEHAGKWRISDQGDSTGLVSIRA